MKWLYLVLAATVMCLWSCSEADTLGDEPPIEFTITGEPSWQNGMGTLIRTKCATCHAVPKPDVAPNNVVDDLDLNFYQTQLVEGRVIRGADSLGRWIFEGILDHPVTRFQDTSMPRQMPLDYATGVTQTEKGYFQAWSNAGLPETAAETQLTGDADAGRRDYFSVCSVCHNLGEGSRDGDLWLGPDLRPEAVTVAKVKSMWLTKVSPEPISDQRAADIRALILTLLTP